MTHTVIETFDGTTAFRKDCRYIKGDFYIKDKQCFNIGGTWYRINSGMVAFDYESSTWKLIKEGNLQKGIISIDKESGDAIMGYFTPNAYRNVTVVGSSGNSYLCLDPSVLPSDLFIENMSNMTFYHKSLKNASFGKRPVNNFSSNGYPMTPSYCLKHYDKDYVEKTKRLSLDSVSTGDIKTKVGALVDNINNYSFGFEFETNSGKVPNYRILESGLVPLRDGSINGVEFATIPLQGKKGIALLEKACSLLEKYTTITENESLHLHIGNIPTDKKFIGYLYTVCCILEKEIYSMFPAWYKETSKFKARGKDYNMPLKRELVSADAKETFDNLAFYLSEGKKYQGFGNNHPNDPNGDSKWNIHSRYHWCNFIPLLFGSNNTIEFRIHTPTRDAVKCINWLYICSAIIKYTDELSRKNVDLATCKHLTLSKILSEVYGYRLSSYLNKYVNDRKANRVSDEANGDRVGATEIKNEMKGNNLYKDFDN
jgi:hypothetical protein